MSRATQRALALCGCLQASCKRQQRSSSSSPVAVGGSSSSSSGMLELAAGVCRVSTSSAEAAAWQRQQRPVTSWVPAAGALLVTPQPSSSSSLGQRQLRHAGVNPRSSWGQLKLQRQGWWWAGWATAAAAQPGCHQSTAAPCNVAAATSSRVAGCSSCQGC